MKKLEGVKVCLLHSAVYVWVYVHMYVYYCVLSKPYLTASVPEHLLQWLQMINDCWHKHKHREAQTEWDRWRQIEAEGEAEVKYPHISIADAVDNRPLKALLFLPPTTSLKSCVSLICISGWEKGRKTDEIWETCNMGDQSAYLWQLWMGWLQG